MVWVKMRTWEGIIVAKGWSFCELKHHNLSDSQITVSTSQYMYAYVVPVHSFFASRGRYRVLCIPTNCKLLKRARMHMHIAFSVTCRDTWVPGGYRVGTYRMYLPIPLLPTLEKVVPTLEKGDLYHKTLCKPPRTNTFL